MGMITFAAATRSWRRLAVAGLILIAAQSVLSVDAQQPAGQSPASDIAISQMYKLAGKVLAQGKNEQPAGELKLRSYLI